MGNCGSKKDRVREMTRAAQHTPRCSPLLPAAVSSASYGACHGRNDARWMGRGAGRGGVRNGGSVRAPTLEKATADKESELRASDSVDAPTTVACVGEKENVVVFSSVKTLKVEGAYLLGLMVAQDGEWTVRAWMDALTFFL